jgi:hypothetical protein
MWTLSEVGTHLGPAEEHIQVTSANKHRKS